VVAGVFFIPVAVRYETGCSSASTKGRSWGWLWNRPILYLVHALTAINDLLRVIDRGRAKEGVTRSEWLRRLVEKNRGR
jgi:hypothetical protein